tara:strand:- start:24880 stop:25122 length:243 start_codon:yes stop_codon:yes gene_type:complete
MLDSIKFCEHTTGRWRGNNLIRNGKWIKKITLGQSKLAWIVLNENLREVACIPINFSIAILPQWNNTSAKAGSVLDVKDR